MYSIALMMALSSGPAAADWQDGTADSARYGNHLQQDQYRRRRGGGCGGGGYGGCGGGYGGCYGGGYGGYGGCGGGYGGYYGGGGYMGPGPYAAPAPARRRGAFLGRRRNGTSYAGAPAYYGPMNAGYYGPMTGGSYGPMTGGYYNASAGMVPNNYQSFYPQGGTQGQAPAILVVHLPPDAQLTIDGNPTRSQGPVREYYSTPIPTGQEYTYHLTARMRRDGRDVTENKDVRVRPGQPTQVVFGRSDRDMNRDTNRDLNQDTNRDRNRNPNRDTNTNRDREER